MFEYLLSLAVSHPWTNFWIIYIVARIRRIQTPIIVVQDVEIVKINERKKKKKYSLKYIHYSTNIEFQKQKKNK